MSYKALFADNRGEFLVVESNPDYYLHDGEILVQNIFSGVNPADIKHATHLGILDTVIGYDFCGHVKQVSNQSKLEVGDLVAGYTPGGIGRNAKFGTHQKFLVCPETADSMYNLLNLTPPANPNGTNLSGQAPPLLIWGASSSVGSCALQFAAASGCYPIFVTASAKRHEALKNLGATHCFDYSSPTVINEIHDELGRLQAGPIQYVFDAVAMDPNPLAAAGAEFILLPNAKLLSTVVRHDKRFQMPLATPHLDFRTRLPGTSDIINIPGEPEARQKTWDALQCAVDNYGKSFKLPPIDVFEGSGEEALTELHKVANGTRGYGKLAIRHPLK